MKSPSPAALSLHQLSLYNTGRMSPDQIIAAFAARRSVLDRIITDLTSEKPKSRAQHHLIVGQRGMGKTMLLARIAAELRTDEELKKRFIPLVFAEEQYAVDRLSKFWLNCLDSLADARDLTNDAESVAEIDATVDRLTSSKTLSVKDDQPYANEVYAAFAKAAQATGQRPVLLVDNLQLVFERLDTEQQHSLRELLMRPGTPILVGASPSPPPQSQDYGAAFYDQFKVHYLRPLEVDEMRDLMLQLATAAGRDDVRKRVLQHPERLKVLRQLTGGNPRTTVTLFFLYAEDFAPRVFGDLEGLLDRVTPLYKARFEELTAQQQVITSAIANHWDPVTAADLVQTTSLPASTLSAQLDRLEKTGTLERVELFGETRTGYMIAERFFNIWFLMRSASRRQRREVEFLTRFLENFYEPQERVNIAKHLMNEDRFSPDRYLWSCAVADSLSDQGTAEDLKRHSELMALREKAAEARSRLHELIDFDALPPATLAFDELRQKLMSLVPDGVTISPEDLAKTVLGDRTMFISGERKQLASRSGKLNAKEIKAILATIAASKKADTENYSEDAVTWFSDRLASGQLRDSQDAEDWNRAFKQTTSKPTLKMMVETLPSGFGTHLSEEIFSHISAKLRPAKAAPAWEWVVWGYHLHVMLDRPSEAENAYREAIERDPNYAIPWNNLGSLLINHLNRPAEAESAYRKAIELDPDFAATWLGLGHLLQVHLYRPSEAESAYLKAIAINPNDATPWNNLGNLLKNNHPRPAEAESAYRKAIDLHPNFSAPWNNLGNLYCDVLNRLEDAAEAYDQALKLSPENESAHQNRLFLRRDFLGEGPGARPLLEGILTISTPEWPDDTHLHEALFAAYDSNWGLTCEALSKALVIRSEGFSPDNTDDWLRASAVLIHLNYGAELLTFLDQRGDTTARLRPWVEAVRAVQVGDKRALQNIAPEIRTVAEEFYDGIARRLLKLPEKTRRRPLPKVKAKPKTSRARRK